jgi:hypothetical protein
MGKHADFKDIVHGLAYGFISRNNDLDGYWAPGKLHALARARGERALNLTLWPPATRTQADPVSILEARYRTWIEGALRRRQLDPRHLQSAMLGLAFDRGDLAEQAQARGLIGAPPLVCRVTLTDDRGKVYQCEALAMCRPHDPARESRSVRVQPQ